MIRERMLVSFILSIMWLFILCGQGFASQNDTEKATLSEAFGMPQSNINDSPHVMIRDENPVNAIPRDLLADDLPSGRVADANINVIGQKCLGGSSVDWAYSVQQTSDKGYVVAGKTTSNDGDVNGYHKPSPSILPQSDFWIAKIDNNDKIEWQKCLGGSNNDEAHCVQQTSDEGYIIAGLTNSNDGDVSGYHKSAQSLFPPNDAWVVKLNHIGKIEWQKCLGGSGDDQVYSIQQTSDGYIVAGYTSSNDGDVSGNHCNALYCLSDYWVVKLNSKGDIQWQKCLGGTDWDWAQSVRQTSDGGYIVAGYTNSSNGDVSGNHGFNDYWVVKLDSKGDIQWQKCLGGGSQDYAACIQQASDGGYIVVGITASNDGDVSNNHGESDYWVVKLNSKGDILWQKCLGGTSADWAYSGQQTSDNGYIVAGFTNSSNGDVSGNHGSYDYWVVKLNSKGNILWQKCLGGKSADGAYSMQQTTDGDYLIAGQTTSNDGDVSGNHGLNDYWVVKLNSKGDTPWQKCLGGTSADWAYSGQQTSDGGYIVAGYAKSNNGNVSGNHGKEDYWVVKLDSEGGIQWKKCLGGTGRDIARSVQQTSDSGYIVAGYTSSNDGDVSGNHGSDDYWVVKLDSKGNILWQKCLGGSDQDVAGSVQQTSDKGYIVAGTTGSNDGDVSGNHGSDDYWVLKLDSEGGIQWKKCLGGRWQDIAKSVQQTSDEGYIVAGFTTSHDGDVSGNHGSDDYWVVKLDSEGVIQWKKCLGGSRLDAASSIQQTSDGGYIITGDTESNDGDVSGNHGSDDYWVVKLDSKGGIQWKKCLGGTSDEWAFVVQQTFDNGYIIAGLAKSNDGDVSGNHGLNDYWVVKLNSKGGIQWQKCLGGSGYEGAFGVQQTTDDGYVVAGFTNSNDGDVSGNHGKEDYWVVKLDRDGNIKS